MMGTILLLLLVPIALWAVGEALVRLSKVPMVWAMLGFSLEPRRPTRTAPDGRRRQSLGRPPDLPPRASLHDRRALPAYEPETDGDGDLRA